MREGGRSCRSDRELADDPFSGRRPTSHERNCSRACAGDSYANASTTGKAATRRRIASCCAGSIPRTRNTDASNRSNNTSSWGIRWLGRVPVREARAVDAAIQHDAQQPTRRLRGQVTAAAQVLQQRPADPSLPLRDAGEVVARLRRLQTDLEQRSLARGRRRDPAVDYERGLAQIARRLQVANRQVADLEAAQRLGREWEEEHAPELARAEAAALTLRARELMLTARLEAYRPAWLLDGVGPAPAEPTRRVRWRQGVLAVLRWRVDHDVVDQRRPLGPEPTDLGELRRYRQAVEQVSGIARSIGHTPVVDSGRSRGRLGEDAGRPPPPLRGRPGIALERDVAEGVGIELP